MAQEKKRSGKKDLEQIQDRRKLQNKILKKMIDKINHDTDESKPKS